MVSVPTHNLSPPKGWARAAIGFNIYTIGGYFSDEFSSRVLFMDCRSHTWHEAPSMQTPRKNPHVSVLDEKIYVVDGCKDPDSSYLIECFDPETQIWEYVPSPSPEIWEGIKLKSCLAIQGKLCLLGETNVGYMSKEKKWNVGRLLYLPLFLLDSNYSSCVINNVVYMYNELCRRLFWWDLEGNSVGVLKGLGELPRFPTCARLVNYGGKVVVFWEEKAVSIGSKKTIWCAEIALERRGEEIYGMIEWFDVVLTLSEPVANTRV